METESTQVESEPESSAPKGVRALSRRQLIAIGAVVALLIAGGVWLGYDLSQRRMVPDLVGLTLADSKQAAEGAELVLSAEHDDAIASLEDENTTVTEQHPAAGETLRANETVSVIVMGREAAAPDLEGLSFSEAEERVSKAEFSLAHDYGSNRPPDSWPINAQDIEAGSTLRAGDVIMIAFDVPEIVMPEVVGSTAEDAQEHLKQLGLVAQKIGEGTHVASGSMGVGTVLDPFTEVEITLGYMVPNVVGSTVSDAKEALSSFTNVTTTGHSARPVTAQSVPAGSIMAKSTEILITSPGPETVYRIIGNGSHASVTWAPPGSFSIQQATEASLPWEMSFPTDSGSAVFNAQLWGGDSITCQLERNGKVVKEVTSTGPYAVVQC